MPHVKHPKLQDKAFLLKSLRKKSRSEVARELGVAYNSVNHQVRTKFTEEERDSIVRKRFSFTDKEKLGFLKESENSSISTISEKHGISRTQLQHWKKDLIARGVYTSTKSRAPGQRVNVSKKTAAPAPKIASKAAPVAAKPVTKAKSAAAKAAVKPAEKASKVKSTAPKAVVKPAETKSKSKTQAPKPAEAAKKAKTTVKRSK